jgi:hypothetical protein
MGRRPDVPAMARSTTCSWWHMRHCAWPWGGGTDFLFYLRTCHTKIAGTAPGYNSKTSLMDAMRVGKRSVIWRGAVRLCRVLALPGRSTERLLDKGSTRS